MSVKTILDHIGSDAEKVFALIASPKGQAVVQTGEAVVETAFPAATGIINLVNAGMTEAFKVNALAQAAAAKSGTTATAAQQATAVASAIEPEIVAYLASEGAPAPTTDKINAFSTGILALLTALEGPTK